GGAGADLLYGGDGDPDRFVFKAPGDSTAAIRDEIADFSSEDGDRIDMSFDADRTRSGEQDFFWVGTSDFSGRAG
ncbi:M10 family metallopeptidase C-terminal domain-containing protein, partial [Salmonella enterica]|uniref:M10 family metallopeptidase C-terminal domain-containing protein n=1 Tax=Salmonella enterica TaxID=28901 RepID=UPI003D767CD7